MARKRKSPSSDGTTPSFRSRPRTGAQPSVGATARKQAPAAGLYLVSTPIGNAADIGLRALEVLTSADVVACEDTRITRKLLTIHGIKARLTSYHDHNAARVRPRLIERLKDGETVALVADAGTPLVSDPGYKLVRAAIDAGLTVTAVPGPSSVLAALVLSGQPTDRFLFAGFLPARPSARRKALAEIAAAPASLVFMESARRLATALADMADVLGARPAAVGRELTKMFEEVRRGDLAELAAHYRDAGAPKGEVMVVVAPPAPGAVTPSQEEDDLDARLTRALDEGTVRDAAARVATDTGLPRRRVYARALELRRTKGESR